MSNRIPLPGHGIRRVRKMMAPSASSVRADGALAKRLSTRVTSIGMAVAIGCSLVIPVLTLAATPAAAASPPTISAISPTTGTTAGGLVVTITGTNFVVGATTVTFGTAAGSAVSCSSTTSCVAASPPGSVGVVDVTATTSGGTSATSSADQFTYAGFAYVADYGTSKVSEVNTASNSIIGTVTRARSPTP